MSRLSCMWFTVCSYSHKTCFIGTFLRPCQRKTWPGASVGRFAGLRSLMSLQEKTMSRILKVPPGVSFPEALWLIGLKKTIQNLSSRLKTVRHALRCRMQTWVLWCQAVQSHTLHAAQGDIGSFSWERLSVYWAFQTLHRRFAWKPPLGLLTSLCDLIGHWAQLGFKRFQEYFVSEFGQNFEAPYGARRFLQRGAQT